MRNWIERQRNIIDFALSSLLRRKRKNAALVFVYVLIVFSLASVMFLTHAIKQEASLILKGAPDVVVQRTVAGRNDPVPVSYIEKMKQIRGVSSVRGRLWGYYYDPISGSNYTLTVPEASPPPSGKIIIGKGVSRVRFADPGDELEFRASDGVILQFEIQDTLSSESELVSSDLVLISKEDFQRLFDFSRDHVTDIVLQVRNPKETPTVAIKIAELLPDTRIILREEILRTYDMVFNWRGGIMLVILLGALLAFAIFSWDKASGLSAEERREIGILKAMGWETSDVLLLKFWEGTVISLSAFFAGTLLAYAHVFFTSSALFEPVLKGWAILYPRFKLTPFVNPYQVITLFFLTVVPYTVATIIPSWMAATIDPDSVMRG